MLSSAKDIVPALVAVAIVFFAVRFVLPLNRAIVFAVGAAIGAPLVDFAIKRSLRFFISK